MSNVIHMAEWQTRRVRHVLGTCAAVAQALDDHHAPHVDTVALWHARLTRARLIQEAIDEAILNRTDCSYDAIIARVAEMEAMNGFAVDGS